MTHYGNQPLAFALTPAVRTLLEACRDPRAAANCRIRLQAGAPDAEAVAYVNESLRAESQLEQKFHAYPALNCLEDHTRITELKEIVESKLQARIHQRSQIPIYQHLDEILDALAGPVILTTDALRRFFHVAAGKLLLLLELLATSQQRRLMLQREEGTLTICVPEAIEQVNLLWRRFRSRQICVQDFLDSPRGAEIFLRCLSRAVACQDDARLLLQMHYLCGCSAQELAEYFAVSEIAKVRRILSASRKKLWRRAIEVASTEPGFNSSWTI